MDEIEHVPFPDDPEYHQKDDFPLDSLGVAHAVALLAGQCHGVAAHCGWWNDAFTGASLIGRRNVPELLCLVHSEISEAMEAHRKDLMDDKIEERPAFEVELADAVIRICDLAEAERLDLAGAIADKLAYNLDRPDHKPEARRAAGGKKY